MKRSLSDLAVFGGDPAFKEMISVGRPNIGDRGRFLDRLNRALDTRSLTNNGPFVHEFEDKISDLTGAKHCVAVCNATIGLEIASRACGLEGEVVIPSFTFVATAHSLRWQGLKPVFADVDARTHSLDPRAIEGKITPRTSAILAVHLWGRACDVDSLAALAERAQLALVFDAAHAFGSSYNGRMVGNFGDAEVFSFHATKFLNSFEGGMIATNDDQVAARARRMRNFGFSSVDETLSVGTNGKMSEVSAAMGLTSLESIDEIVDVNRTNHLAYTKELSEVGSLRVMQFDSRDRHNFQYVVTELQPSPDALSRDELQAVLLAENVMTRRYFYPGCHRLEPYATEAPVADLPVTDVLTHTVFCFPTGTAVNQESIERISEVVRFAMLHGSEVRERLTQIVA